MDVLIAFAAGLVAGAAACFYVMKRKAAAEPTSKIKSGPPPIPPR